MKIMATGCAWPRLSVVPILSLILGTSAGGFVRAQDPKAAEVKPVSEVGEFRIYIGGKEIGNEKFTITSSQDSATSSSVLQFHNPEGKHEKIELETKLEMNGKYVPRRYELKSNVDGQKGTIIGTFAPNQAIFEYLSGPITRKSGVVVGDKFTILDTNIFHHFVFLERLFDYDSKDKSQKFEVAIPQEPDSGFLNVTQLKRENISVRGRKIETRHLQADSGTVVVDLWVDDQRLLLKVAVKSKNIEVVRK